MRAFACIAFGLILRLHPHEFRDEFGDEMLWIVDEQMRSCKSGTGRVLLCTRLLLDGFRSAIIQNALREQQQPETIGPHFGQIGSSTYLNQISQAGFLVFACLFNIFCIALGLRMVMSSL